MTKNPEEADMATATAEPEIVTPEIVEPHAPSTEVARRASEIVEAAANAAVTLPGVAGRDEFLALASQARILSLSAAAPKAVRGNPYLAFHLALIGRDLGISPSAALELVDVIGEGDRMQLALSPQLVNGQIKRLGLGAIVPGERTELRAVAIAIDANGQRIGETEFTWADAQGAGLADKRCRPTEHAGNCRCRQGYKTYPKRMLWWRSCGWCADDFFPEASIGIYRSEELASSVDEQGRAIDPATIDLPEGYGPDRPPPGRTVVLADPADIAELQVRVQSLPPAYQDAIRENWKGSNALAGNPLTRLPATSYRIARALVEAQERHAREADKWHSATARNAVRKALGLGLVWVFRPGGPAEGAQEVQDEPEPGSAPDGAREPEGAAVGPPVASGEGS